MKLPYIIKRPILTERSLHAAANGKFTFEVDRLASKGQVREAVETYFGVNVISVNTVKLGGKRKRVGKRRLEKVYPSRKKAIVQLKQGQKIDLFEIQEKTS